MTKSKATDPVILEMAPQRMAVVTTKGEPNEVGEAIFPALFGAVYAVKFQRRKEGKAFPLGSLRARWPDAHLVPKEEWTGIWGLPLPEDVADVPQKRPGITVAVETWDYGTVAQILHLGPFSEEGPTVERLHQFIAASGYEIAGTTRKST